MSSLFKINQKFYMEAPRIINFVKCIRKEEPYGEHLWTVKVDENNPHEDRLYIKKSFLKTPLILVEKNAIVFELHRGIARNIEIFMCCPNGHPLFGYFEWVNYFSAEPLRLSTHKYVEPIEET